MPRRSAPSAEHAASVFDRHGLGSPGIWGESGIPTDEKRFDGSAAGLCEALSQLGGIYAVFARFLAWRADLLGGAYISELRKVRLDLPVVPQSVVAAAIHRELGSAAEEVASNLSPAPVWNTLSRTAYLSKYRLQPVFVQVARDPVSEESLLEFEKGVRSLGRPELAGIVAPSILLQFREWVRNGESMTRERSFLEVLGHYRGETLVEYPSLIPELCTASLLCWTAVEGLPVSTLIERGDAEAPALVAAAILEQFFSLSMVDADLDLDAMIVGPNRRLYYRRLGDPVSVLPGVINTGIKYVSAVLAGNAHRSAQTLIRLIIAEPPLDLEKLLMEEFSGVEPELKINRWFPASAGAFESNWRALARLVPSRPLFLDCLHRNLLASGYWNSDAVRAGAPPKDGITEAMWPVLGRLIRTQWGMMFNRESAEEWAFGSGLLMFATIREMNRLVEEVRDNDITVGVDAGDWRRPEKKANRISYHVILGGLLVFFLLSLQWGSSAPEPWSLLLKILAAAALPLMFWAFSKIG
ncbi:MAG TPA: hypothetical protein VL285_00055 [Bryobacteraceae bacterium]|nr:hypothetical protein [Bryobacteraceae bacterium]